jgi:hypothetical protein
LDTSKDLMNVDEDFIDQYGSFIICGEWAK